MGRYIGRRLLISIPVIWGVATIVFFLMRVLPGDPAQLMLQSTGGSAEQIARLRHNLGLDDPIMVQYWKFISGAAHGDLGHSLRNNQPVMHEIRTQISATLQLTVASMLIAIV